MANEQHESPASGLDQLRMHLDELITFRRAEAIRAIEEARQYDGFSENHEYVAAREELLRNEQEILRIEAFLDQHTPQAETVSGDVQHWLVRRLEGHGKFLAWLDEEIGRIRRLPQCPRNAESLQALQALQQRCEAEKRILENALV